MVVLCFVGSDMGCEVVLWVQLIEAALITWGTGDGPVQVLCFIPQDSTFLHFYYFIRDYTLLDVHVACRLYLDWELGGCLYLVSKCAIQLEPTKSIFQV